MVSTWKQWQTFNAGMVAFLAAAITATTAVYLDRQATLRERRRVKEEQKRAENQIRREYLSARAFLPHSLALISSYVEECTLALTKFYTTHNSRTQITVAERKELTSNMLSAIKPKGFEKAFQDCIKFGNEQESIAISKLLTDLQIYLSRMSELESKNNFNRSFLIDKLAYSIYFDFKISGFYDFTRDGSDIKQPPSQVDRYYTRLNMIGDSNYFFEEGKDKALDNVINFYARRPENI